MDTNAFDRLNEDYKMFSRIRNRRPEFFKVKPYASNGQITPKIEFCGVGSDDVPLQVWWTNGNDVLGHYLSRAIHESMPAITVKMALLVKQDLEKQAAEIKKECAATIRLLESQHGV